jgi:hypothetical protein
MQRSWRSVRDIANKEGKSPLLQGGSPFLTRLEAPAHPAASPALFWKPPGGSGPEGKLVSYFFLTGFLVAFFFAMVLFSFGLDLAAFLPGFFIIAIRSSYAVAAAGRAQKINESDLHLSRNYRNALCKKQVFRDMFIKKF